MKTIFIIIGILFVVFFAAIKLRKRQLRKWRDEADFNTVRGQATIKACNQELDFINGYTFINIIRGIFNQRKNTKHY